MVVVGVTNHLSAKNRRCLCELSVAQLHGALSQEWERSVSAIKFHQHAIYCHVMKDDTLFLDSLGRNDREGTAVVTHYRLCLPQYWVRVTSMLP